MSAAGASAHPEGVSETGAFEDWSDDDFEWDHDTGGPGIGSFASAIQM